MSTSVEMTSFSMSKGVLTSSPMPQVLLHDDHSAHSVTLQSLGALMRPGEEIVGAEFWRGKTHTSLTSYIYFS